MPQVTIEDLDTVIIRTTGGDELSLVSWSYLASMAGLDDDPGRYDLDGRCYRCGVKDWQTMWRWFDDDNDMGDWECANCLLKDANNACSTNSWYILAR